MNFCHLTYNHYQPNSNAGGFTGLDTYLKSRDTDLSDDVNRSPFSGKDIAPDSYTNGADAMAGQFYTVGAAIKSVSAPVSASGGNDRVVTVSFTYTGDTTTSGYAEIYYGLTIARPGDITPTSLGAHAWTGGSLQTTVQIGNAGATSIQLAPGAILWEPALTIDKQLVQVNDPDGALDSDGIVDQAGDVIHYNVVVHNSGNQTLTGVTVNDPLTGLNISNVTLNTGQTITYTQSYTVQQADLDSNGGGDGDIDNTATADSDQTDAVNDSESVLLSQTKQLHLEKDASVPGGSADTVGELISYTLAVTNQGNAAIADVTVSDAFTADEAPVLVGGFNSGDTDTDGLLDVSETWHYTASHAVTQAELDAGTAIVNTATASGTHATSDDDDASVDVSQTKQLHLEKDASVPGGSADTVGELISYTLAVTNQGNAAIADVTVSDAFTADEAPVLVGGFNSGDTDTDGVLDVSETWHYTASHAVTQAELDAGTAIVNTATASGTNATSDDDDASVDVSQITGIDITKYVSVDGGKSWSDANSASGAPILVSGEGDPQYKFVVTNTGNITLNNVVLSDLDHNTGLEVDLNGSDAGTDLIIDSLGVTASAETLLTSVAWRTGSNHDTATATWASNPLVSDSDDAYYTGQSVLEPGTGVQFNFPNGLSAAEAAIQVKLQGTGFSLQSKAYMMWDFFTSDMSKARIDTALSSLSSGYPDLKASATLVWQGTPGSTDANNAIYRIYVANETDHAVALQNNTNIVNYTFIGDSNDKKLLDLINSDPLNAVSNNMTNIENAVLNKNPNGFVVNPGGSSTSWNGTDSTDKVWASPQPNGSATDEAPVNYDSGNGNDAIYGRNNTGTETTSGSSGNDLLHGPAAWGRWQRLVVRLIEFRHDLRRFRQ